MNNLALVDEIKNNIYCSKETKTEEDKKELYNALEECDILLNDIVGQNIKIKDVYVEEREIVDEQSGELKKKYRTILFDENGTTYVSGAYGIFNALKKIFSVYGLPTNWENPIEVEVIKKSLDGGKKSLSLKLV